MKTSPTPRSATALAVFLITCGVCFRASAQVDAVSPFNLSLEGASRLPYIRIRVPLSDQRPAGIVRELVYQGKPEYGVIHVGNGPASTYFVVLDESAQGGSKIDFDKNRNGDLTDDGPGDWSRSQVQGARTVYGPDEFMVRASDGTADHETSSSDYALRVYRLSTLPDARLMFRASVRVGTITVAGKPHKAILAENDSDALFAKPLGDEGQPAAGQPAPKPVWLMVDLNDDSAYASGRLNINLPFKLGGQAYVADVAPDGSTLKLDPTTRPVPAAPISPTETPLLVAGTTAPDFAAVAVGGGSDCLTLAQYRGRVVILDSWSTWCGPCQESLPHVEQVFAGVKGQDVAVIGICVWDDKDAYLKWLPDHTPKLGFTFAFDPAGKDTATSIAMKLYRVTGIPTTYVIGKDGKVAASILGFSGTEDKRLEAALAQLGVSPSRS